MCTKSDVKRIVDDKIDKLELSLVKIIKEEVAFSIKDLPAHKTAPKTRRDLDSLASCIASVTKNQNEVLIKVNEIHAFYTGAKFLQKTVIWFFSLIGIVAGGILACRELFKN